MAKKQQPTGTAFGAAEYVVYTISVSTIPSRILAKSVSDVLAARQIPGSYQHVHVGADIRSEDGDTIVGQEPSSVSVPRLCTFWRGQSQEDVWTDGIREALKKLDLECAIACEAWAPLPNYPKGAI